MSLLFIAVIFLCGCIQIPTEENNGGTESQEITTTTKRSLILTITTTLSEKEKKKDQNNYYRAIATGELSICEKIRSDVLRKKCLLWMWQSKLSELYRCGFKWAQLFGATIQFCLAALLQQGGMLRVSKKWLQCSKATQTKS